MSGPDKPKTPEYEIVQKENHIKNAQFALDNMRGNQRELLEQSMRDTSDRDAGRANATNAAQAQQAMKNQGMNKMAVASQTAGSVAEGGGQQLAASAQSGVQSSQAMSGAVSGGISNKQFYDQSQLNMASAENERNIADSARRQARTNDIVGAAGMMGTDVALDYNAYQAANKNVKGGMSGGYSYGGVFNSDGGWRGNNAQALQDHHSRGLSLYQNHSIAQPPKVYATAGSSRSPWG